MEEFLATICTPDWHAEHDRGRDTAESCAELAAAHPAYDELIWAWARRTEEMIGGVITATVEILAELKANGVPCYALTNMEVDTYPRRVERFPFLGWFDGSIVSGYEGVVKPEPRIFELLLERFALDPRRALFVDDRAENVEVARSLGFRTVLFRSAEGLRAVLEGAGLLTVRTEPLTASSGTG